MLLNNFCSPHYWSCGVFWSVLQLHDYLLLATLDLQCQLPLTKCKSLILFSFYVQSGEESALGLHNKIRKPLQVALYTCCTFFLKSMFAFDVTCWEMCKYCANIVTITVLSEIHSNVDFASHTRKKCLWARDSGVLSFHGHAAIGWHEGWGISW